MNAEGLQKILMEMKRAIGTLNYDFEMFEKLADRLVYRMETEKHDERPEFEFLQVKMALREIHTAIGYMSRAKDPVALALSDLEEDKTCFG